MKLTTEKIDLLVNGTRDERLYACPKSFYLFAVYGKVREAAHFRLWTKCECRRVLLMTVVE
jgi:hypothetical protein